MTTNRPSYVQRRLEALLDSGDAKYIPPSDRKFFWETFKQLRRSGWGYQKAWDYTCWALMYFHGCSPCDTAPPPNETKKKENHSDEHHRQD